MKANRLISAAVAFLCASFIAHAQFSVSENDPFSVRWQQIGTRNFRIIYPQGFDSLARVYLSELEKYRPRVANSIGMVSGQFQNRPLDVILHTRNAASNGMVSWTPSRMEMNTVPCWNEASALPWVSTLAVHEGRHAAQMQMGYRRIFRPFRYITGQIVAGAACAYPGSLLLEGDAVVAETALSRSGRGRQAQFLQRYIYSWDNHDYRNYSKWRFGSYYHPAPDNYALGYAMISGVRTMYDAPYFMAEYFDYVGRRPYDPWPLRHNLRRVTGKKFKESFRDIMDVHYQAWAADTLRRGPFMPSELLLHDKSSVQTYYSNIAGQNDTLDIIVRKDSYHLPAIYSVDYNRGSMEKLRELPSYVGFIDVIKEKGIVLWNEVHRNPRWGQQRVSVLKEYNLKTRKERIIRHEGSMANPAVIDDSTVAVIEYEPDGGENICIIDIESGDETALLPIPDGYQAFDIACVDSHIYVAATTEEGMGIWRYDGWETVLPPVPVQITTFESLGSRLLFQSDHNGVMEFYSYDTAGGALTRISNTRYGGEDFYLQDDGDLVFTQINGNGNEVRITRAADLPCIPVDWNGYYRYPVADMLSAQEDSIRFDQRLRNPRYVDMSVQTEYDGPKPYRKLLHGLRFHSWAPVYVDTDVINDISFAGVMNAARLGVTAWFQNSTSTLSGYIGYKAEPDAGKWFHSGHLSLTYKGMYPVFEFQLHVNESERNMYRRVFYKFPGHDSPLAWRLYYAEKEGYVPYVSASLRSYIPLQWNEGVWNFGAVPQAGVSYSNDVLDGRHPLLFNAGARVYAMQGVPEAAVYPRWGAGAELMWLDPYALALAYGYIPGICCGQGIRLSAIYQRETSWRTTALYRGGMLSLLPRGFTTVSMSSYGEGCKLTVDYAIPFYMGDWNIGTAFMCKRGIITPFFDWSLIKAHEPAHLLDTYRRGGSLYSAGGVFELDFGSFFWIKVPVTCGFFYAYSGGSLFDTVFVQDRRNYHHNVGATFKIKIPD